MSNALVRIVAQAVNHRLPTAAVRIRAWVRSSGVCGIQSCTGAGFLRILRFPLPVIPPIAPHSSLSIIIQGWYSRPVAVSVIMDSVPLHPKGEKMSNTLGLSTAKVIISDGKLQVTTQPGDISFGAVVACFNVSFWLSSCRTGANCESLSG
jgi:hypothetical protein